MFLNMFVTAHSKAKVNINFAATEPPPQIKAINETKQPHPNKKARYVPIDTDIICAFENQ